MDPHSFGDYPAAIELVAILNKRGDSKLTHRVARHLSRTIEGYVQLDAVEDDNFFCQFALMWRLRRDRYIEFNDPEINSFVKNVSRSIYRAWLTGATERRAEKHRARSRAT